MKLRPMTAIVLAIALAACGGGGTTSNAPADQPADEPTAAVAEPAEPTEAPAPTEEPAAAAPAVGTEVAAGELVWVVGEVNDRGPTISSGNQFVPDLNTTGRFIEVKAGVHNGGKDQAMVSGLNIVDDQGREFSPSTDAVMIIPAESQCMFAQVNPGIAQGCVWIYEVPTDAKGLKLKATGGILDEPVLIDLGQ